MGFARNKKLIIRALIVIIIALILFAGYIVLVNNSKFKVKFAIRHIFNKTYSVLNLNQGFPMTNKNDENKINITNRLVAKVSLSNDVKQSLGLVSNDIEKLINNSTIQTNITSDIKDKYMDIGLNYIYDNEQILANAYVNNDTMYILLKSYLDKYIQIDSDYLSLSKSFNSTVSDIDISEFKYLVKILENSIADAVDYADINDSKTTIDIDDKKVPVNKTTLIIDTNFKNRANTILLNKILMDNKAKEIILKLVDSETYPDIKSVEDEIRNEVFKLDTAVYNNEILGKYSIYTSGIFANVVRSEIKYFEYDDIVIQYTTYKAVKFDSQIAIYQSNILTSQMNVKKLGEDVYDITLNIGKNVSIDIEGVIAKNDIDVDYTIRISGTYDIKGEVKLKTDEISDKEIKQTFSVKLNTPESYGTANITIDSNIKIIDNIEKPDFNNSVKLEELTEEEIMNIVTNFESKNPKIIKLINDIVSSLMFM